MGWAVELSAANYFEAGSSVQYTAPFQGE